MILDQGPSQFDGAPIVAIATGYRAPSANPKTGPVAQVWILRADEHPQEAVISGRDASICGDCLHRGDRGQGMGTSAGGRSRRSCYVCLHTPGNVWKQFRAGRYPGARTRADYRRATAYGVRVGAYGDPAEVPWSAWVPVIQAAPFVVGYTQFPERAPELRGCCMASASSLAQAERYRGLGWRTYRVLAPGERPTTGERMCPASVEGGRSTVCLACRGCDGTGTGKRHHYAERVHGSRGGTSWTTDRRIRKGGGHE
jgi:hypothetical protein